jgi:hypothetical protein
MAKDLNELLVEIGWVVPEPQPEVKCSVGISAAGLVVSLWGLLATIAVIRAGWRELRAR